MELQVVSCIRFSMQLLMAESIFTTDMNRKSSFWARFGAGFAGYWAAALATFEALHWIPAGNPLVLFAYYLCLFLYSLGLMKCCFQAGFEELLFAGVCGYAAQHIAFAVVTVFTTLTGAELSGAADFLLIRFLPYVLTDALIYLAVVKRNRGKGELKKRDIRMVLLALAILLLVIMISVLVDHRNVNQNNALLQNVFCKLYAALCCAFAIFMAFDLSRENRILHEKEMMERMLQTMGEQQKLSQEAINIINIKCHDLKYRISKIARIENEQDQKEYINDVKAALSIYDNIFQTGNEAIDLVLTEKSLLCNEHEIKLSSMVDGSLLSFMSSADIYALFGNLLDNAMESVLKEADPEKRIISLLVSRKSGGVYIHMENYCREAVSFEDGLPLTTKEDKAYHGFGVRSIRYLAEKYKGSLLMQLQEDHFLTDLLFYPDEEA